MSGMSHGMRSGAWWGLVLGVALGAQLAAAPMAPAVAQEPRGLMFVGGIAYEPGGPGRGLLDELVAAGYSDRLPSNCAHPGCEPPDHPFYHDEGLNIAALVGMRYRFDAPFSLEMLGSNGQRGHAEGYSSSAREYLIVAYSSLLLTTTLGAHVGPIRLEAGPVFNSTGWEVTRNSARSRKGRTSAVGGTAGVSGGVHLGGALLSLKVGIRGFPGTDLRIPVRVPFEPDYHSFFIGVTAIPTGD